MQNEILPLPLRFEKNGFLYWQICRTDKAAIYEQRTKDGRSIFYEVWKIRRRPARVIGNTSMPAHETGPTSEQWGREGWTFYNLIMAREKYNFISGWDAVLKSFNETDQDQDETAVNVTPRRAEGQPGDQVPTVNLGAVR